MTDLALCCVNGQYDLVFQDGDLVLDESLLPAVLVSMLTDRLADPTDAIPDGTTNRRGFWADAYLDDDTPWGSRAWLLMNNKNLPETLTDYQTYDLEALQWLVDQQIVASVTAVATATGPQSLLRTITLQQEPGTPSITISVGPNGVEVL